MKDLYTKNSKTLIQFNKTNKWINITFMDQRNNVIKMSVLPKVIYRFNKISINISRTFFIWTEKSPKICMRSQKPMNSKNKLEKEQTRDKILPDFKLYYKAIVIKKVWYWHKNRHIDQWKRTKNPKVSHCIYSQLTWDMELRNIQFKMIFSFNKECWKNWITKCRIMKLDSSLHHWEKLTQNGLKTWK